MAASLLDPALLALAVQSGLEQNPMFNKNAYIPPGGMDPAAAGGGAPPGMDPAAAGGASPGAPPAGMDPAAAGGAPPAAPPAPPPMGAPPTVMDPTGMAGMMPQQPMAGGGGGGEQKKKLDPAMLDARLFTIQQLLIGLYEAQGIPLPAKAMMGNIPDPQSQMMADQQFSQQDQQATAAAAAAPGGAPTGAPPGGAPMDPAAASMAGGGMPMDPAAGMPPKTAEVVTRNKTAALEDEPEPFRLGTALGNQEVPTEAPGGLMATLFDEASIMAEMQAQFGSKTATQQPAAPPTPAGQLDLMSWLQQQTTGAG